MTEVFKDITITKPAAPPSNEVLLEVLYEAAASGELLATLATINAVAASTSSTDEKFSGRLLDAVSSSGVLSDPTPVGIDATFSAIGSVLQHVTASP